MHEAEAQRLLRRYQLGQCTPEERELVHRWYESLGEEISEEEIFQDEEHKLRVQVALQRGIAARTHPAAKGKTHQRPLWNYLRTAAAAGLLLATTWVVWYALSTRLSGERSAMYRVLHVPAGKTARVQLADGSSVWLNANSRFRYPVRFTGRSREVYLEEGEAFFEVNRDEKKPFRVYATRLAVKVLGTSFNVKAYAASAAVTVAVATGKVAVSDSTGQLGVLTPNEALQYEVSSGAYSTRRADVETLTAWREGRMIFRQAGFAEVARMLENRYGIKVTFSNKALQHCRFTARFEANESLENVLTALSLLHSTRFSRAGNRVTITGEGCSRQP